MSARAPLAFRVPGPAPAPAHPDTSPAPARRERPAAHAHDLARIPIRPPAAGGAPIQAAGLFEAYRGLKGRAGRAYGAASRRLGAAYSGVRGAITGSRGYQAIAGAYSGLRRGGARLAGRVRGSGLYRGAASIAGDVRAIGEDIGASEGFQKARAVAGVLGLAGGYRQGYGEHGAEARGAFRGRWERYFESLPPEKRAQAMKRYTLPEPRAGAEAGDFGGGGDPGEIEMQELAPRGGGSGGCPPEGGQIAHPESRFDRTDSAGGGPCPGGSARFPSNRFGD